MLTLFFQVVDNLRGTDPKNPSRIADPTAVERHIHYLVFHRRKATLILVLQEKNTPRTVHVVTPIALWTMTLLTTLHDIDTLTVWTMDLYIVTVQVVKT